MRPAFTVIIYTPQELNHSSYIQTGLFELEKLGLINVKIKLDVSKNLGRIVVSEDGDLNRYGKPHPKTSFYKLIDHKTGDEILFATDLYDHANEFSEAALSKCDFLFKRSYESKYVAALSKESQSKIHKLGMTFGAHSEAKKEKYLFKIGLFISNLRLSTKWDRMFFLRLNRAFKLQKRHWQFINTSRPISRFENYTKPTGYSILFQTRCFLNENDIDVKEIHEQRYHIIKLLRNNFPDKFLGGFVPSKIATEKYRDALTNVPTAPEEYLDALKKAKIVVYTRGLADSPAWKMSEYLSQGKVIIAETLSTELPVPLVDGKEVLLFNNDNELLEKIKKVLENNELAEQLSKNARAYFEKYVHPVQNTKRILEMMLDKTLD